MRHWFLALMFAVSAFAQTPTSFANREAADGTVRIVASIKPIHSLVAGIMQGVAEPELLLDANQSPHHYSLRPSERHMLAQADAIFWVSPTLESFMPRLLHGLDEKTRLISLIKTDGLIRLPVRNTERAQTDPHIWLNTYNIEKILDEITRQLISLDPTHAQQYTSNNKHLQKKTNKLRIKLNAQLRDKDQAFLTYHDGYQYFEQEFNLKNAGFVSRSSDLRPSARHIQNLRKAISEQSIHCVFYDAPFEPPIVTSLIMGNHAKAVELDPTGMRFATGETTIFQTLQNMANKFDNCL